MKSRILFLILLFAFGLYGCTAAPPKQEPSNKQNPTPTKIPAPGSGNSTVTGKMINVQKGGPLPDTLIRLAKIYGEGQDAIFIINDAESPGTYTDTSGVFVFTDVPPASYAVLFTDKNGDYLSIKEKGGKILTVDATVNKVVEMGEIKVDTTSPTPTK